MQIILCLMHKSLIKYCDQFVLQPRVELNNFFMNCCTDRINYKELELGTYFTNMTEMALLYICNIGITYQVSLNFHICKIKKLFYPMPYDIYGYVHVLSVTLLVQESSRLLPPTPTR